mmetsp:Transcript_20129/g.62528  ORF Transcript_20129/g.62528 Transcript_20129/m.62528 type:complete len:224 (-) Transcript_20129:193-864(-)
MLARGPAGSGIRSTLTTTGPRAVATTKASRRACMPRLCRWGTAITEGENSTICIRSVPTLTDPVGHRSCRKVSRCGTCPLLSIRRTRSRNSPRHVTPSGSGTGGSGKCRSYRVPHTASSRTTKARRATAGSCSKSHSGRYSPTRRHNSDGNVAMTGRDPSSALRLMWWSRATCRRRSFIAVMSSWRFTRARCMASQSSHAFTMSAMRRATSVETLATSCFGAV